MVTQTATATHVIDLIRRHLDAKDREIDEQTRFSDDLGADSLALVELTLVFEEAFDIDISEEEAEKIRTVQDAISSVERCLRERPPSRWA